MSGIKRPGAKRPTGTSNTTSTTTSTTSSSTTRATKRDAENLAGYIEDAAKHIGNTIIFDNLESEKVSGITSRSGITKRLGVLESEKLEVGKQLNEASYLMILDPDNAAKALNSVDDLTSFLKSSNVSWLAKNIISRFKNGDWKGTVVGKYLNAGNRESKKSNQVLISDQLQDISRSSDITSIQRANYYKASAVVSTYPYDLKSLDDLKLANGRFPSFFTDAIKDKIISHLSRSSTYEDKQQHFPPSEDESQSSTQYTSTESGSTTTIPRRSSVHHEEKEDKSSFGGSERADKLRKLTSFLEVENNADKATLAIIDKLLTEYTIGNVQTVRRDVGYEVTLKDAYNLADFYDKFWVHIRHFVNIDEDVNGPKQMTVLFQSKAKGSIIRLKVKLDGA